MGKHIKASSNCLNCAGKTARAGYKYCCNKCQFAYQRRLYLDRWKLGLESGLIASGVVSSQVKQYLREKFNNECCLCAWSEVNLVTGIVPLVADHVDGNWRNNRESNLRLICPNCDSLTSTYAALNKGKGRPNRAVSNRSRANRNSQADFIV